MGDSAGGWTAAHTTGLTGVVRPDVARSIVEAFVGSLMDEAELPMENEERADRLAAVSEALVSGLGSRDEAATTARQAREAGLARPVTWTLLRRHAREESDARSVSRLWSDESAASGDGVHALVGRIGALVAGLAHGRVDDDALAELHARRDGCGNLREVVLRILEVCGVFRGDLGFALRMTRARLRLLAEATAPDPARVEQVLHHGLAIARAGGDAAAMNETAATLLDACGSEEALRVVLRSHNDEGRVDDAGRAIQQWLARSEDAPARARWLFEHGLTLAGSPATPDDAVASMVEAARRGPTAPAAARWLVDAVVAGTIRLQPESTVDALGLVLDFASSPEERADVLAEMATAFAKDLGMHEAALELARDAVGADVSSPRARTLLVALLQADGQQEAAFDRVEKDLDRRPTPLERIDALGSLALQAREVLRDPAREERILRMRLDVLPGVATAERLADLLTETGRADEACDLLRLALERHGGWVERAMLLERLAALHEMRGRPDLALPVRRQLAANDRGTTALLALRRVASVVEGEAASLAIEERLMALPDLDRASRVALHLRAGQRRLALDDEPTRAEAHLRAALDEAPAHPDAILPLLEILRRSKRWEDAYAVLERAALSADSDEERIGFLLRMADVAEDATRDGGRAEAALRRAIDLAGTREDLLIRLERVLLRARAWDRLADLLAERRQRATARDAKARLAWREALIRETHLGQAEAAAEAYVDALDEPICAPLALHALDRLAPRIPRTGETRARVRESLRRLGSEAPTMIAQLAAMVHTERFAEGLADPFLLERLELRHDRFPEDESARRWLVIARLRNGDVAGAMRACITPDMPADERLVAEWLLLEMGVDTALLRRVPDVASRALRAQLAQEFIAAPERDAFEGAGLRRTLAGLRGQSMTTREILALIDDSQASQHELRLAWHTARALRDARSAIEAGERVAAAPAPPIVSLYRWIHLTEVTDEPDESTVHAWLARGLQYGCYEAPLRARAYDLLEQSRGWAVLEHALAEHLERARPPATVAGTLSARRARALEALGRAQEAIAAWAFCLLRCPADAHAALAKARLETEQGQNDEALCTLEDALAAGVSGSGRVDVLLRLADLHWDADGKGSDAVKALESAWETSGFAGAIARRLAHAHARFGDPARAVQLLHDCLPTPPESRDLEHWLRMARLRIDALDQADEGEAVLWQLLESFPSHRSILDELQEFHRNRSSTNVFVDRLGDLLAADRLALPAESTADLWRYIGEINHSVLRRFDAAENAFQHAARHRAPTPGHLLRWASSIVGQGTARVSRAAELCIDALRGAGADLATWKEGAHQLARVLGAVHDTPRLRMVHQLQRLLGEDPPRDEQRGFREPQAAFTAEMAWRFLGSDLLDAALRDTLAAHAPLLERVASTPSRPRDARRLRADDLPDLDAFLTSAARWLETTPPRIDLVDSGLPCAFIDASSALLHVDHVAPDHPARTRFWAAWCVAVRGSGLGVTLSMSPEELGELVEAVATRELNHDGPQSRAWDAIGGLLLALQRRRAAASLRENEAILGLRPFPDVAASLSRFADRAGLLFCGDLGVAAEEILSCMPLTSANPLDEPRLRDLALFAIDEPFQRARSEAGLDGRQWLFGG